MFFFNWSSCIMWYDLALHYIRQCFAAIWAVAGHVTNVTKSLNSLGEINAFPYTWNAILKLSKKTLCSNGEKIRYYYTTTISKECLEPNYHQMYWDSYFTLRKNLPELPDLFHKCPLAVYCVSYSSGFGGEKVIWLHQSFSPKPRRKHTSVPFD